MFKGFKAAVNDFARDKGIFDRALLTENYDVLSSIIWEFNNEVKFAASGFEAPAIDLIGNDIQDLLNFTIPAKHVYLSIFPENGKTFCIIAWLKEDDIFFSGYRNQLADLNNQQRKNFINNELPIISENIVINPESWNKLENDKKEEFYQLLQGMDTMLGIDGGYINRLMPTSYNLFEL